MGRQAGIPAAGHYDWMTKDNKLYMHNMESFRKLWDGVGVVTDSKWAVDGFSQPVETKLSRV